MFVGVCRGKFPDEVLNVGPAETTASANCAQIANKGSTAAATDHCHSWITTNSAIMKYAYARNVRSAILIGTA